MSTRGPDPLDVSTDDLRYLLAVARSGRLVSAATLLGVDHTTVRRRLDRLETALGVRLLDRGADGWELTAIGRDVAAHAAPLEHVVEQVLGAASGSTGGLRGTVRIVAPEGFATTFATPCLARVQAHHPGIVIELVTSTSPLSLRGSGYDIAVNAVTPAAAKTAIFDQITEEHINFMLSKIPRNRFVRVEELASMVAWIASADNSFTTGAVFDISGGRATY